MSVNGLMKINFVVCVDTALYMLMV